MEKKFNTEEEKKKSVPDLSDLGACFEYQKTHRNWRPKDYYEKELVAKIYGKKVNVYEEVLKNRYQVAEYLAERLTEQCQGFHYVENQEDFKNMVKRYSFTEEDIKKLEFIEYEYGKKYVVTVLDYYFFDEINYDGEKDIQLDDSFKSFAKALCKLDKHLLAE